MTIAVNTERNCDRPKRAFCTHQPKWQRYQPTLLVPDNKNAGQKDKEVFQYQRQYSHVYSNRLVALKPRCWKTFDKGENNEYAKMNRVLELREDVPSRIVGTIVKEVNDPKEDPIHPNAECRPSDQLFLEDESGRVALKVDNVHEYCTGVVVGVQGTLDSTGTFHVEEMVLPAPAPKAKLPPSVESIPATIPTSDVEENTPTPPQQKAPHLLLVSSLLCGDPSVSSLPRELFVSYLHGQFTTDAAKVCRVLIVGGGPSDKDPLQGLKELDAFIVQLTKVGIPVDIMPGKNDPTTANWPQRPLHSSLLPNATSLVHRTPNPYAATLGQQLVVATDGTNIHDLQRHILIQKDETSSVLDEVDALKRTLDWSHICPTGPDSVPTVPHLEQDPMVLDQMPQLYVAGNSTRFATAQTPSSTLVCVPKFSQTGEAVLVNMENMKVDLLRFEAGEE